MKLHRETALVLVTAGLWLPANAAGTTQLALPAAPPSAACVDGWTLSANAIDVLLRATRTQNPSTDAQAVIAAVVQDRALAAYARRHVGDDALFDDARVGYALEATVEAALTATLARAFQPTLRSAIGPAGIEQFIVRRHVMDASRLREIFTDEVPRLDDRIEPAQLAALAAITIFDYRFDGGDEVRLSVKDLWPRLDVHGRNQVHHANLDFVQQQGLRILSDAFVRHWTVRNAGLGESDLSQLRELMADRERHKALALHEGAMRDPHRTSPALDVLKRDVTAEEIALYFAENADSFNRVERVRARHIRCKNEACGRAAANELANGEDFSDVARRRSVADTGSSGGELGWIDLEMAHDSWLYQLVLALPAGSVSPPIREPDDAAGESGWQIVRVDERVVGRHEVGSEAVRFAAVEAVASRRAAEHFTGLREQLIGRARVRSDGPCVDTRSEAPDRRPVR